MSIIGHEDKLHFSTIFTCMMINHLVKAVEDIHTYAFSFLHFYFVKAAGV